MRVLIAQCVLALHSRWYLTNMNHYIRVKVYLKLDETIRLKTTLSNFAARSTTEFKKDDKFFNINSII